MAPPDSPRPSARIAALRPGAVARLLTLRLEDLAAATLESYVRIAGGVRGTDPDGREWIVRLDGNKRGLCLCLTRPAHTGDPLVFVSWARFDGDRGAAVAWSREFLRQQCSFRPPPVSRAA